MHVPIIFMYLPPLLFGILSNASSSSIIVLSLFTQQSLFLQSFHLQMENSNPEIPCKIRKRRFPTTSSSSFVNSNMSQLLIEQTDSLQNEKCMNRLDRSTFQTDEQGIMTLQKSGADNRVHEMYEKSIVNLDRSRNKSRESPCRDSAPEVINPRYGGIPLICDARPNEGKPRPCVKINTETKNNEHSMPKSTHGLDEIKHSLTISKELLKLLTHIWTVDTNHSHHHHPTSISLVSTLNHELNKARSHVNKLIKEQRSMDPLCESKDQDKVRLAVKSIAHELETERKLRRQTERMNKKLGRELANTKASLGKAIKKAEADKQAAEMLEQLCEKMARSIEEDRVELEELKRESERVREEMEEEREMLRVADMLREERVQMKLIDAKYEYEDKHEQVNVLVHDLEQLLEADNGIDTLKSTPEVLTWYQSKVNKCDDENTTRRGKKGEGISGGNTLVEGTRDLSWYDNIKGEVNDEITSTRDEVIGRNSDCIEWEFGLDMRNGNGDLNECLEETVLGFSCSSTMKEYEDEMERYKLIKDLRDRIVSCSDLSRDTLGSGSYI
ncbi:unnamed protein product [Lactuca saligna]|uniref:Uncharacterized protein n=1 Tax=Lactuca saligna TaxID=75948 RepID=A0AA36DZL7_LACSI|nr:unnamed protein product [Lactuca saligna]